jgi:hypothetical protein
VRPGERVEIHARATNTGDTVWLAQPLRRGGHVGFGCKLVHAQSGRLVTDLGRTRLDADVPPGGQTSATLVVDIPSSLPPGGYVLKVDLVDEFVCWFSDLAPNVPREHHLVVAP